ncbi:MAG: UDP-N-acetylmuramate dehydrogenase [Prolixibacteraceae bacterium]|nr:UDP-N-acetylmuramate dehydrogenase [Prolixibacteraceae bacterium]
MVRFFENFPLKQYNTFGLNSSARYFFEFTEPDDLPAFLASEKYIKELPLLILGGGSNILFLNDFNGIILYPKIPGINICKEDRQYIWIEAGAGEVWDDLVKFCVDAGLGGLENLSDIPGSVGAAPVQNIGAYGQEAGNAIELVKGYDLVKKETAEFKNSDCEFEYRNSLFKRELKNRFVITSVVFRLDKFPEYNLSYGKVEETVKAMGEVNLQNIRKAVKNIRSSKLPDVNTLGNAGSFFKNPVVKKEVAEKIQSVYSDIPVYQAGGGQVKIAAGWLIDKSGWRGRRSGNVGVYSQQALVLVNYGGATGAEIYNLSEEITRSVFEKFGISLEREVNCI